MLSGDEVRFWVAVVGAIILKLFTSEHSSVKNAFLIVCASIFMAWVFTDPVVHFLDLDPENYRVVTAALLALTGESLIKWIVKADPWTILIEWRNGRK